MKKKIAIIGGGTAALFLAAFLNTDLYEVTIYEKNSALGRKFLVAGDGGFNLTHSEDLDSFKSKYTPSSFLNLALDHFNNSDLRAFLLSIGIPTFIGSSGRIFPEKGIKPIAVLKAIESYLNIKNIKFEFNKTFTGWDKENNLAFNSNEIVKSDYAVFALGGASWKVTGSDGSWLSLFDKNGINTSPFKASNCAYKINWTKDFIKKHQGSPLKNISITLNDKTQKGEVVITKFGLEGNAIYALSPEIQMLLDLNKEATVFVDFKSTQTVESLIKKIRSSKSNLTTTLREKIKLPNSAIQLIKTTLTKDDFLDLNVLAKFIKKIPITIVDSTPINEAISTTGGINLTALDKNFEVRKLKNTFCLGEMLDWNAPTGGYLIQGCASMGAYLAKHLNNN